MQINIDLDGVLAKFLFGTPFPHLYRRRYFENLPPQINILLAVKLLASKYDVCILSAYLEDSKYALMEKKHWLWYWLPEIPEDNWKFLPCGQSKGDFLESENDILIDDRWLHGKEWTDAGGKFIKVSVNRTDAECEKKKYPYVFSPDMSPQEIVNIIERRIYETDR